MLSPIVADTQHGAPSFSGPCDIAVPSAWYGLRACKASYRGNALINVCTALDAACGDLSSDATTGAIVISSVGGVLCTGAVTLTIKTFYDQTGQNLCGSGASCDETQATIASRAVLDCSGSYPIATMTATQGASSVGTAFNYNYPTSPFSLSTVAKRTANFTTFTSILGANGNQFIGWTTTADTGLIYAGGFLTQAATDNAPHAMQGLFNSASSSLMVDGSSASGNAGNIALATGRISLGSVGGFGNNSAFEEGGVWTSDVSSSFAAITTNQRTFYGF